ncbi:hypothetical protein, partial [Gordonia sp. DT101]|uniref:hypothetical protein n=1 Tax=Gordonia sp. DT101 TaxID=3416545 RepID=UPI003CED68F6
MASSTREVLRCGCALSTLADLSGPTPTGHRIAFIVRSADLDTRLTSFAATRSTGEPPRFDIRASASPAGLSVKVDVPLRWWLGSDHQLSGSP